MSEKFDYSSDDLGTRAYKDKSEARDLRKFGDKQWGKENTLKPEDLKKKKHLVEALEDFQASTGIDEKKYIQKLNDCRHPWEVNQLEKDFKKAGTKWYEMKIKKSGIFEPMDHREEEPIGEELNGLIDWFSKQPLYGDTSMIETLKTLDQDLEVKRKFRDKLKKQSTFVRDEYFRRLGSLPLVGSKEQLLENVLKEVKEVEDSPSAVQYEFKKKQKATKANKNTTDVKKDVLAEYKRYADSYQKLVLENQNYFGGKPVATPFGKIPAAAREYLDWFNERKNFAEMQDALKKLPEHIRQRKKLYAKRDTILQNALPKDRERLEHRTNLMRKHELEKFLPDLEKYVRENGTPTAEFVATILSARAKNIDLYQPLERVLAINKFKLADLETQKAKLIVLREEVEDRAQVVHSYFGVPSYLRNDKKFLAANAIDREVMLMEAREQINNEQKEPFDSSHIKHMGSEQIQQTKDRLKTGKGKEVLKDVMKKLDQEGEMEAAKVQAQTYKKIFGAAKRGELHYKDNKESQKKSYLRDLKYWVRMDQNVDNENDVRTERERNKLRYIKAADEAYDMGYVVNSGGRVKELQTISADELKHGNKFAKIKLDMAQYGEHVRIDDEEGKMAKNPLKFIAKKLSGPQLRRLTGIAAAMLGESEMHLGGGNLTILKNSPDIRKEIARNIVDEEMDFLKMDAANNNDEFINAAA